MSYRRHRRFLPSGRKFRYQKKPFDGEEDHDHITRPLRGVEIVRQLNGMTFKRYGKMKKKLTKVGKRKRSTSEMGENEKEFEPTYHGC